MLLLTSAAAAPPARPARPAVTVTPGPCVIAYPVETRCGHLEVPENYDRPAGRRLRLPYAIFPASEQPARPDPILLVPGGASALALAKLYLNTSQRVTFDPRRDMIFIEVRGTGYAQPSLACSAFRRAAGPSAAGLASTDPAGPIRACHAELVAAGFDLAQYRTAVAARDIAVARRAFGFERWNLYGGSYGTTLAEVAMAVDPYGIRSVMLDAVSPPQLDIAVRDVTNTLDQVTHHARLCATSTNCRHHLPDLKSTVQSSILNLQERPLPTEPGPLDGSTYFQVLTKMMQHGTIAVVPTFVNAVANRDTTTVNAILADILNTSGTSLDPKSFTPAVLFSVYCADLQDSRYGPKTVNTLQPWPATVIQLAQPITIQICRDERTWPVPPAPATERSAVRSSTHPNLTIDNRCFAAIPAVPFNRLN